MPLVAGVDSSTQSCKVVICDADSGEVVRTGSAPHPPGTEVDPQAWWTALVAAIGAAGGLRDVAAMSVAGQQHGLIALDADGTVIRPALLWNDTRSAAAAAGLVHDLGEGDPGVGATGWAEATGSVPVASLTVSKLRWLARHEPQNAARLAAVALPHDWLTWRLSGATSLDTLVTDRSDASGTGYVDVRAAAYRHDLLALALDTTADRARHLMLPRIAGPSETVGSLDAVLRQGDALLGPGCGDNAGAALGLGLEVGGACVSVGTSGVVSLVSDRPTMDASGLVSGFADATGRYLPLACTLNGAQVLDATAALLGVDHDEFSTLALSAPAGSDGLVFVPYLQGERTPNLPTATGVLSGLTLRSLTRAGLARAAVEGLLGLLAGAMQALQDHGAHIDEVRLVGGAAHSMALRELAPRILGVPVQVPEPGEWVALGAARQAAWVLSGAAAPPAWAYPTTTYAAPADHHVRAAYRRAAEVVTGAATGDAASR